MHAIPALPHVRNARKSDLPDLVDPSHLHNALEAALKGNPDAQHWLDQQISAYELWILVHRTAGLEERAEALVEVLTSFQQQRDAAAREATSADASSEAPPP